LIGLNFYGAVLEARFLGQYFFALEYIEFNLFLTKVEGFPRNDPP